MKLGSPEVASPVSVASGTLRVRGQMPGSTVTVYRNGASWFDQPSPGYSLRLTPPGPLAAGDEITATQEVGGDASPPSPIPVVVQPVGDLDHLAFGSYLYECAEGVLVTGATPGATVEFKIGAHASGAARAEFGDSQVLFGDRVGPGERVEVRQIVAVAGATSAGVWVASVLPDEPPHKPPHRPTIAPAEACQTAVELGNLVEGTRVRLSRTAGPAVNFVSVFPIYRRSGLNPLVAGEVLTAGQDFALCGIRGPDSAPVTVGPTGEAAPTVRPGLCAGGRLVRVAQAEEGARVVVYADGAEVANATAYSTECDIGVEPLAGGARVTARLVRCGVAGGLSDEVVVNPAPGTVPPARIPVDPLYECATTVPVAGAHPGSRVVVYSQRTGLPVGGVAYAAAADLIAPVAALVRGDRLFVRQYACDGSVSDSAPPVGVAAPPQLTPPEIEEPLYEGDNLVVARGVVAGAQVDFFVNGVRRATATAAGASVAERLSARLTTDQVVSARQRLCYQASNPGTGRVVRRPLPVQPYELSPDLARGATPTALRPVLRWVDMSAPINKPGSYEVQVATRDDFPTPLVASATVPDPPAPWAVPVPLGHGRTYYWRVRGVNSSGPGRWATASFQTLPEPPPPPPPARFELILNASPLVRLTRINSVIWGLRRAAPASVTFLNGALSTSETSATASYSPPGDPQGAWYFSIDVDFNYVNSANQNKQVVIANSAPIEYIWAFGAGGVRSVVFQVKLFTDRDVSFLIVELA